MNNDTSHANLKRFAFSVAGWRPIKYKKEKLICEPAHNVLFFFRFVPLRQAMRNSKACGLFIAGWRPIK